MSHDQPHSVAKISFLCLILRTITDAASTTFATAAATVTPDIAEHSDDSERLLLLLLPTLARPKSARKSHA